MTPLCGPVQGKDWGTTRCIFCLNGVEIWELHTNAGWRCSEHYHDIKWNRFHVISGKIAVVVYQDDLAGEDAQRDVTILSPGMCTDVPPMKWHYFAVLEDSVVLEAYWTVLSETDINRRDKGCELTLDELRQLSG